ncbi:unnamed protein product, partial [Rotaria magnacalcarata]
TTTATGTTTTTTAAGTTTTTTTTGGTTTTTTTMLTTVTTTTMAPISTTTTVASTSTTMAADVATTGALTVISNVLVEAEVATSMVAESVNLFTSTYVGRLVVPEVMLSGRSGTGILLKSVLTRVRRSVDGLVMGDVMLEEHRTSTIKTPGIIGISPSGAMNFFNSISATRTDVGGYASSISSMKNGFSVYSMISRGIDHRIPDSYDPCNHSFPVGLDDDDDARGGDGGGGCYYPPTMLLVLLFLSSSF